MASRLYDQLYRQAQVKLAGILQGEERSIIKLYGTALHDIRKILKNLYDKYSVEGKLTNGEMSKYNRLANVQDQICRILQKNMKQVDSLTKRLTAEQYSEAFYRHAYAIDQVGGMALNWGLIPEEAVEAAMKSPFSKLASSKALAASREGTVDRIRQEIGLSIIRGDSYDVLANRISAVLGVSPKGAGAAFNGKGAAYRSLMVARTEGQRILVEGQMAATQKALELGCEIETIWDATLDSRTRPAHAALDGRPKDNPEKGWFVPEIGYVTAPLHSGVASFDINCRCRTRDQVKGFPPEKRYVRGDGKRPYEKYDQWMGRLASENKTFGDDKMEKAARGYQMYKLRHGGKDVIVDPENKLKRYCLNPEHSSGKDKARVFSSALGIGQDDYKYLENQIRNGLAKARIEYGGTTETGRKYSSFIEVRGLNGKTMVVTVPWIFDFKDSLFYNKDGLPRLVSAFLDTKLNKGV